MRRKLVLILIMIVCLASVLSACAAPGESRGPESASSVGTPGSKGLGASGAGEGLLTGSGVLDTLAGQDGAQKVYYGGELWYVVGYDNKGNSAVSASGRITFLHVDAAGSYSFNSDAEAANANAYTGSALQGAVNSWLNGGSNEKLNGYEQAAILPRTLDGSMVKGDPVTALLWPLPQAAAAELPHSLAQAGNSAAWWLCSPGETDANAQFVDADGNLNTAGTAVTEALAMRPAFDIDAGTVLFTSLASGGKASGAPGPGALTPVVPLTSDEWKLTLRDDGSFSGLGGHSSFSVDSLTTCDGVKLNISYSGAATGVDEYISGIVTGSDGYIKYYGRFAEASSSGTVAVDLSGKYDSGDTLYIFNEKYCGDWNTDFASALKQISIPSDTGHTWKDATCTAPKTCTVCGATEGEPLGHTWKDATCTEPKTCTVCGATDGSALGHKWEVKSCTEPRVCSVCGTAETEPAGHDWKEATCTAPKTCARCGLTEGEALGHTWKEATCTEPKTCTTCGATEGTAPGHKWKEATCTEPKTCTVCGATEGTAPGHKWKDADCVAPKVCTVCGAVEGEALGHSWKDATCTEPKTCSRCGKKEGEALGHKWKEATCTEPKTCTVCNATDGKALGHTWSDWVRTKEPEVGVEGVEEHTCSRCGGKEARAVPALKLFKVTFDTKGGSEAPAQNIIENKAAQKPEDPTKEGYRFGGWFADSACTKPFDFSKGITADTTVYASWIEIAPPVPISYKAVPEAGESWTRGSGEKYSITVTRSVDEDKCFDHYVETLIDGNKAEVSATAENAVITVDAETLEKLSPGQHTVTVQFDDGKAEITITVEDSKDTPVEPDVDPDVDPDPKPDKGGSGNMLWLILIPIVAIGAIAGFLLGRRKGN